MSNEFNANSEYERLHYIHSRYANAANPVRKHRREDEEFYFGDVEGTRSQFTKEQIKIIQEKYDVPVGVKLNYAIIEQILSLLTGTKPYPKLLAPTSADSDRAFTAMYEKAVNGIWYESDTQHQLTECVRDMLSSGSGFVHVRKSNFWSESSFDVVHEYTPWHNVYVDPNSKKADFSDAECIVVASLMTATKAEKEFGITITKEDMVDPNVHYGMGSEYFDLDITDSTTSIVPSQFGNVKDDKSSRFVWVRHFYEKEFVWVYITDTGDIAKERPTPTMMPNQEKIALGEQLIALKQQSSAAEGVPEMSMQEAGRMEQVAMQSEEPSAAVAELSQKDAQASQDALAAKDMNENLQQMQMAFESMPDEVPAYKFKRLNGTITVVSSFKRIKNKHIKHTLVVGRKIYEKDILKSDEYPIIHFCMSHNRSPNRTYSITHYIKDIVKASNKFLATAIYEAQIHSRTKVLAEESTITDKSKWQNDYALPGALLTWKANVTLGDGGKPEIIQGNPINQTYVQFIQMMREMAEYITGLFAALQGNQENMPDSLGGIQSLQAAGGQRVKLYSRYIESAVKRLVYVTVCYVQQYTKKEEALTYFDENGDGLETKILEGGEGIRFKVRSAMTVNLPTVRHMTAQLLAAVSGQTGNPAVADVLTKYMIKNMDMPEADAISEEIDTVKMLQQQLQQMQMETERLQKENNMLVNNQSAKDLSNKQQLIEQQMQSEKEMQVMEHENELGEKDEENIEF